MRGKNKCKILKQIRQQIAQENDIPLVTKECTYQGECSGTCPRCEAELRYLEQQLARRQALGKTVTVAALSAGLMAGAVGCSTHPTDLMGDLPIITAESSDPETMEIPGDIAYDPSLCQTETDVLYGDVPYIPETENSEGTDGPFVVELDGDVAYNSDVLGMAVAPDYTDNDND